MASRRGRNFCKTGEVNGDEQLCNLRQSKGWGMGSDDPSVTRMSAKGCQSADSTSLQPFVSVLVTN